MLDIFRCYQISQVVNHKAVAVQRDLLLNLANQILLHRIYASLTVHTCCLVLQQIDCHIGFTEL